MILSAPSPRAPARFVTINALAKRLGVTSRTLRHYEEQGMIHCHRVGRNIRAFDQANVAIAETVVALRDVDIPIPTIREILTLRASPLAQASAMRSVLLRALSDKQQEISRIEAMIESPPRLGVIQA